MTGTILGLPDRLAGLDRTLVMGVVNVTPDSFSDGGNFLDVDAAIAHGLALVEQGADLVDVGGESTRPGAGRVPVEEERRRVLPVVRELAAAGVIVSIDTMRAEMAELAISVGAAVVNDVSGGLADDDMAQVVAAARTPYVVMHWRGHSDRMTERAVYDHVVTDVVRELGDRLDALVARGIHPAQLIVDPGLGFAKRAEHSWALLSHLDSVAALGRPVLVGASRKGFLGQLLAAPDGTPRPVLQREDATTAVTALAAAAGVWAVRVHAVRPSRDAVAVVAGLRGRRVAPSSTGRPATVGRYVEAPEVSAGPREAVDRIVVTGITATGHHGVYPEERAAGQRFVVDVTLHLDLDLAARSDEVTDTVHYGELAVDVVAVIEGEPVDLVETLAQRVADVCLARDRVERVDVTVHKPDAPVGVPFDDIAVTLVRSR